MAVFSHLSPDVVAAEFTHKAWFGLCPVWFNVKTNDMTERNWVPEWWLWVNVLGLEAAAWCVAALGGTPVNGWPIRITAPLPGQGGGNA